MISKIVISSDFENIKLDLQEKYKHAVKFYEADEFLLDNANAVINESYIAESGPKLLVLMAKGYRNEAQNRLLKIIEEPPRNIYFMIVVPSRNLLLPTIRSRLMVENLESKKEKISSGLNIKQLDLKEIYDFLSQFERRDRADFSKNDLKDLLIAIITEALEAGVKLSEEELSYCYKLVRLADLNTRAQNLLTPLLLTILKNSKR